VTSFREIEPDHPRFHFFFVGPFPCSFLHFTSHIASSGAFALFYSDDPQRRNQSDRKMRFGKRKKSSWCLHPNPPRARAAPEYGFRRGQKPRGDPQMRIPRTSREAPRQIEAIQAVSRRSSRAARPQRARIAGHGRPPRENAGCPRASSSGTPDARWETAATAVMMCVSAELAQAEV
jgi:hypothetical protein